MTADPPTVKQLEERLYLTAKSLFEYADPSTLAKRVREAAGAMKLNSPSLQPLPKPRVVPPRTITYAAPKSFQKASAKNLLPVAEEDLKKADDDCVICIEPLIVETTSPVGNCGKTLSRDERRLKKRDKLVKLPCGHMVRNVQNCSFNLICFMIHSLTNHPPPLPKFPVPQGMYLGLYGKTRQPLSHEMHKVNCGSSGKMPNGQHDCYPQSRECRQMTMCCIDCHITCTDTVCLCRVSFQNVHCSGFESCGTITIQYQIPRTTQLAVSV